MSRSHRYIRTRTATVALVLFLFAGCTLAIWLNMRFYGIQVESFEKDREEYLYASRGFPYVHAEIRRSVEYQTGVRQIRDGWPFNQTDLRLVTDPLALMWNCVCNFLLVAGVSFGCARLVDAGLQWSTGCRYHNRPTTCGR